MKKLFTTLLIASAMLISTTTFAHVPNHANVAKEAIMKAATPDVTAITAVALSPQLCAVVQTDDAFIAATPQAKDAATLDPAARTTQFMVATATNQQRRTITESPHVQVQQPTTAGSKESKELSLVQRTT